MPTNPQYGGSGGVNELDIGQIGGVRQLAGDAYATIAVLEEPDIVRQVENAAPQQDLKFVDLLGFDGTRVRWRGAIRTKDHATMNAIESEIDLCRYGSARNLADGTRIVDRAQTRPTKLTNHRGGVLTTDGAVLRAYRRIGPRRPLAGGGAMTVIQEFEMEFEILK